MKCVICKSSDVEEKVVEEEIRLNKDVVFIPIKLMVCRNCGEKYYSRQAMRQLEQVESNLKKDKLSLKVIGKVFKSAVVL